MTEFTNQLGVLIRKNFMLKKKSKCGMVCEIIFPLIVILILFLLLSLILSFKSNYDIYELNNISQRVSPNNVILYGSNSTWNSDQIGVMNQFKSMIAQQMNINVNETSNFFNSN